MPQRRAGRTKLSRRRRTALRPFSPEIPFLLPPPPGCGEHSGKVPDRRSAGDVTGNGLKSAPLPGSGDVPGESSASDKDSATPAGQAEMNGSRDENRQRRKRSLTPEDVPDSAKRPRSPSSDGEEDLLLAQSPADDLKIVKGDVVFVKYQGFYYPALVTRFENKKVVSKFVYDLVKFKMANPFKRHLKACRRFTYEEKRRCLEAAETADAQVAEMMQLSLEAVEELEASRATEPVDDPEEFFKNNCDYIVRLRSASSSPVKGATAPPPGALATPVLFSPLRPLPSAGAGADSDEDSEDREEEEEVPSPPPPPRPRPPLPPELREEQRAYAAHLLDIMLSEQCRRHLMAVHAGNVSSWRRDAFWRGCRRRLLTGCTLGDLETCPELATRARSEALRVAQQLQGRRPTSQRLYAEEVLAPEAMLFAMTTLSDEPRSEQGLEQELARGAVRFRT